MNMIKIAAIVVISLILIKVIWVWVANWNVGRLDREKSDILGRSEYLSTKIVVEPEMLLDNMPKAIGPQFQGEWALYSCSMYAKALANISMLYPETRSDNLLKIDSLISIVLSTELRRYDSIRWCEDPLETLDGTNSHISYLSHLAWMIGNYKRIGGNGKYDELYDKLCSTMDRRIKESHSLNLPTYPGEPIYLPDMLVAIVALNDYANANDGKYSETVRDWLSRAKTEWIDPKTGLLTSFLDSGGQKIEGAPVKGSYSALNCYYLSLIDYDFGKSQYDCLKHKFMKGGLLSGIKEYTDRSPLLEQDVDAGVIVCGLSPSGTAFAIGSATMYDDSTIRKKLLRTAEIVGHSIGYKERHYWLAEIALVGEAVTLAMRTTHQ